MKGKSERIQWFLLAVAILAFILVPFFLFGTEIEEWTKEFLVVSKNRPAPVAAVLGGLLASDIALPVPSSIVSTACGLFFGFNIGTLVSLLGMTVSCLIGFSLAIFAGRPLVLRLMGELEMHRLEELSKRFGNWIIVICRPVPVLAEASVLFVGLGHMSALRFIILSTLSNLGVSAVYAAIGAYSANMNSFFLAVAGSVLVPGVAMMFMKRRAGSQEHRAKSGERGAGIRDVSRDEDG